MPTDVKPGARTSRRRRRWREHGGVIVDCALYEKGHRQGGPFDLDDLPRCQDSTSSFVWIGLYEPTDEEFAVVRKHFGLHPLAVEDAIQAHQRPKLDVYEGSVFVVVKTAEYVADEQEVKLGEIQMFIGDGFVVHVRHGAASPLTEVRRKLEASPRRLVDGPSAVLHAIVDHVVDGYGPVVKALARDVEQVEDVVFSDVGTNPVERIYKLKREVLELSAAIEPLAQPLEQLARGEVEFVHAKALAYFSDVHDHVLRLASEISKLRDLLTSILEANLIRVSIRQNDDMRKISAWVAIAAVPTMLAGIYGMNFEHMPELSAWYGYPLVLAVMATVCILLYRRFRKSGWL
jgi:magnesium transporter